MSYVQLMEALLPRAIQLTGGPGCNFVSILAHGFYHWPKAIQLTGGDEWSWISADPSEGDPGSRSRYNKMSNPLNITRMASRVA